jgi:hypothetical protein
MHMSDKPIIFSAPMVRALLEGRKTQTRRILKPQPPEMPVADCAPKNTARHAEPYLDAYCGETRTAQNPRGMSRNWHWWQVDDRPGPCVTRTKYAPGDRLWVRESCRAFEFAKNGLDAVEYLADRSWQAIDNTQEAAERWGAMYLYAGGTEGKKKGKTVPPIHMPRWASRLTLTVTDVRVQLLQEISEADAIAEGCRPFFDENNPRQVPCPNGSTMEMMPLRGPIDDFRNLWNSINGPDAWESNPWVAAYTFEVSRKNIDAEQEGKNPDD